MQHGFSILAHTGLGASYNWRDDFVKRQNVQLRWGSSYVLPEIEAEHGQLDLAADYKVREALKINFSASNINDSETKRYLDKSCARYNSGVIYCF